MAKKKLLKRANNPVNRVTKTIPVEDTNGNKSILKATVIGVEQKAIRKEQSHGIVDEDIATLGFGSNVIKPPLSQKELAVLSEYSSELGPNIDAMVVGIEGFGSKIEERKMTPAQRESYEKEIDVERRWIQTHIIENPNPKGSLRKLRKQLLKDRENTGNAYVELVPSISGQKYSCYNRIEASTVFIVKADNKFTRFNQNYINENLQIKEKSFLKKFRKFVQVVGKKQVFFKEFRDPRFMDARTGEILELRSNGKGKKVPTNSQGHEVPRNFLARELFHFHLPTSRKTPYGIPRFVGNIIGIKGSRSSEESNILTLQNNNVPSMAVLVSGGMLTEGSIQRIQEFVDTSIKGDLNYSKFLILEGESTHDALSGASSMKIEIQPLTNNQHTDALWSDYDAKNNTKVRRSFRQPPILVGDLEDLGRDTAQESERLAEKYIYNPEREELDEEWNSILIQQGIRFHLIKTNSPNVTNDEDLVKILSGAEKTGGVTPRIAHMILSDILNRELPPLIEDDPDFDPDLPFSISVGKLARGMARSNGEGTLSPTGQQEGDKGVDNRDKGDIIDQLHNSLDPHNKIQSEVLGWMEELLDVEGFGLERKDFFKHEH